MDLWLRFPLHIGAGDLNWEFIDMQQLRMTPDEGAVEAIVSGFQ